MSPDIQEGGGDHMPDVDISQFFFLLVGDDGTEGEGVDIGVSPLEGGCCISKKRNSGKEERRQDACSNT